MIFDHKHEKFVGGARGEGINMRDLAVYDEYYKT